MPFAEAATAAARKPGVYMVREGAKGPVVYVGMASGLRGRLSWYASGKAITSGLGEAVADRAFADVAWLKERLDEAERGESRRALAWGKAAFDRADLFVRWAITSDTHSARILEEQCGASCTHLWNRLCFPHEDLTAGLREMKWAAGCTRIPSG